MGRGPAPDDVIVEENGWHTDRPEGAHQINGINKIRPVHGDRRTTS